MNTNTSVTLELQGEVDSDALERAIVGFTKLIRSLSHEIGKGVKIEWIVEDMQAGSLSATLVGQSEKLDIVERVASAFTTVGRAIADKKPIPYPDVIRREAHMITEVLNGKVTAVHFRTPQERVTVHTEQRTLEHAKQGPIVAYGAIEGNVQTLTNRGELKFTLYDSLNDRAVVCHLREGQEDLMRKAWGNHVIVQGYVTRDNESGRPLQITRITNIVPVIAGDFRRGRGALKTEKGDPNPEDVIRRLRDA